ncbi:unnamed protein product [Coregonus sp. 'balchen']|nr:unnamed protein product [Coregonus sp. 'balchen']
MQHPNFETHHPLQPEGEQETVFDPLHNFNRNRSREWDDLFLNSNYLARIRQAGISGRLRSSRFRSVCWKSLWNKFFQDKELRGMIKQDVMRTFPEMRYFQEEDVRTKLTDILFCYARENEQLLYKQGMHELLAPIVFVLHCDHQAFQHASETAHPSEEMMSLLNPVFHEHDAYAMFSQLMETAEPWFSSFEREVRRGKDEMLTSMPFARPQDSGPSVAIVTKVNRIQDQLTCLGLLMHYPPIGDIHTLLHKALFLRDPKNNPRPANYQFQQNLDYYKTRGADLVNNTHASAKMAPLNINKVSSSLLNFGRKLIAPALSGSSGISPINSDVLSAPSPLTAGPLPQAEPLSSGHAPLQTQTQPFSQHSRLLKSESMPVHLSKDQTSRTASSSPSIESLPGGRGHATASPPLPVSRESDISTSSPPLSATKKDSFFNITRSRSHSKTMMGKKEAEEGLEAQVSFLQGQINDLEAMSKYCKIQEVILQEHLEKEDEVLVSLAGLKQIKDILKGALRFNQSLLEAEENEEITIADDHYDHAAAAAAIVEQQHANSHHDDHPYQAAPQRGDGDGEQEEEASPPESSLSVGSEGKNWDDYILVSQDGELQPTEGGAERTPPIRRLRGSLRVEPEGVGAFQDPLMGAASGSSSPDEGSTHSKDYDFTIVNPQDL